MRCRKSHAVLAIMFRSAYLNNTTMFTLYSVHHPRTVRINRPALASTWNYLSLQVRGDVIDVRKFITGKSVINCIIIIIIIIIIIVTCGPLRRLSTMSTLLCTLPHLFPAGCCSSPICCIHVFRGRPGSLRQFVPEQRPAFIAMTCFKAWCAGTLVSSLTTCPNSHDVSCWLCQ